MNSASGSRQERKTASRVGEVELSIRRKSKIRFARLDQIVLALVWLSTAFSGFFVEVGFGLKPFMIVSLPAIALALRSRAVPRPRTFELVFAGFLACFFFTGLYASEPTAALRLMAGYALLTGLYGSWRALAFRTTAEGFERSLTLVAYASIGFALLFYALGMWKVHGAYLAHNGQNIFGLTIDRTVPRLIGGIGDPNIFAFSFTWVPFLLLTRFKSHWLAAIAALLTLFLTFSKGAIAGFVVGFAVYLVFNWRRDRSARLVGMAAPWLLAILVVVAALTIGNFKSVVEHRVNVNNPSSGRIQIWLHAIDLYRKNPLTGIGINNFRQLESKDFAVAKYMHNTYLEVLVEGGIVTFLLYLSFQVMVLRRAFVVRRRAPWLLPTLAAMQVEMMGLSLLIHEVFFLIMAALLVYDRHERIPGK